MEDIGAIGALSSQVNPTPNGFSDLTSDQFVKIMFTELTNQDPLKPSDSQAMLDQISSLRSIESDLQLEKQFDQMINRTDFAAASGLIGQLISGITTNAEPTIDQVFSVSNTEEGPILNLLGGQRVRFADVVEVADPKPDDEGQTDG